MSVLMKPKGSEIIPVLLSLRQREKNPNVSMDSSFSVCTPLNVSCIIEINLRRVMSGT